MEQTPTPLPDRKVGSDLDASGNPIDVWFSHQISGSRCMPVILRTFAEIMEKGLSRETVTWGNTNHHKAVYCTDPETDKILGGIAFEYIPMRREGWIVLSFTEPEARGRRINQVMHDYFEKTVMRMGGDRVGSHISVNNESRLKAAERAGLKPIFYRMEKILSDPPTTDRTKV